MSDLISRQAAIEAFCDDCRGLKPGQCRNRGKEQTMIDIGADLQRAFDEGYEKGKSDRPQGEWIDRSDGGRILNPWWEYYGCNRCGYYGSGTWNYCPNCGAKMGGDTE